MPNFSTATKISGSGRLAGAGGSGAGDVRYFQATADLTRWKDAAGNNERKIWKHPIKHHNSKIFANWFHAKLRNRKGKETFGKIAQLPL